MAEDPGKVFRRLGRFLAILAACRMAAAEPARAAAPSPLAAGQKVEDEIGGDRERTYGVLLEKGQFLRVVVEQRGVDVVVYVRDPTGRLLLQRDALTGAFGTERIFLIAATAGVHPLTLRVLDPQAVAGRYAIRVIELRASLPADRRRVDAQAASDEGARLRGQGTSAALAKALPRFERALSLWQSCGEREEEALTLYDLAALARSRGDNPRALELYGRVLGVARRTGDRQLETRALDGTGFARIFLGDPGGAVENFEKAIAGARELGDRQTETEALNHLGWAETQLGQYQKAIDAYEQAIAIGRARRERLSEAWPTNGLALAYLRLGETKKSLETYGRALALWRSLGDRRGEILTLQDSGFIHWSAGDSLRALQLYEETLPIARAVGDGRGEALARNNIGLARASLGDPKGARESLLEALVIWRRMRDRPGEIQTLHNLGRVEAALGRPDSALALWSEVLVLTRRAEDLSGQARSLAAIARVEEGQERLEEARSHAQASVAILEAQRGRLAARGMRSAFLSAHHDAFEVLVDVLLRLHQRQPGAKFSEEAFAASERGRGRSFLEALEEAPAERGAAGASRAPAPVPVTADQVRARLAPDCALVAFWLGTDRAFAFVATRGAFDVVPLPVPTGELSERVGVFVDRTSRGSSSVRDPVENRLYRDAVAPWRSRLAPAVRRLILVPDRALHSLPFEALRTPDGRTLLQDFVVSYAPSASLFVALAAPQTAEKAAADVLALANPRRSRETVAAFDGERFEIEPLPYAQREAREAARFGGAGSRVLSAGLTEAALKAAGLERFRVLHFATHGLLSLRSPERSALLLLPGGGGDGLLEAREIYGLRLHSDLVVLSACQSARGKLLPGEGVEGLARAFLQAGARTVVASLWNVNDESAAELMGSFYRRLAEGTPKAEGFRAARLDLLARHPDLPARLWAPFVLIGEPDGIVRLRLPPWWRRLIELRLAEEK